MQLHTVTVNHASAQLLGFVYRFSFFNAIISAHDQILYNAPNLGQRESLPLTPVELLLPDSSAQDGKRAMFISHRSKQTRASYVIRLRPGKKACSDERLISANRFFRTVCPKEPVREITQQFVHVLI